MSILDGGYTQMISAFIGSALAAHKEKAMDEPILSLDEAQEAVDQKVYPRVTRESIIKRITNVRYIADGTGTFVIIEMINGFEVNGYSKPADERNYDLEVGKRYAYENAFRQLWQLEGYLLCEDLSAGRHTASG